MNALLGCLFISIKPTLKVIIPIGIGKPACKCMHVCFKVWTRVDVYMMLTAGLTVFKPVVLLFRTWLICTVQVLSVTLDEWSDDEIDSMTEVGGNSSANAIYEAFLPEGVSKPGPDSSHEERMRFIRLEMTCLSNPNLSFFFHIFFSYHVSLAWMD